MASFDTATMAEKRKKLDGVRDLVVATLHEAKSDADRAFEVVAPLLRSKLANANSKAAAAAGKRGRRPPASIKVSLDGFIGAEFRARIVKGRDGAWTFDAIDVSVVLEQGKRPQFGAVLSGRGITYTLFGASTGARAARLVAHILAIVARGKAHFAALGEALNCRICGRALVDERSVESGVGPECVRVFFGVADAAELKAAEVEELTARVKAIRAEMKAAHPDLGGTGDGALFAKLSAELKQLRADIARMEAESAMPRSTGNEHQHPEN